MFRLFIIYSFIFPQIAASAGNRQAPLMLYTGIYLAYLFIVRWFPVFPYDTIPPENHEGNE